MTAAAKPTIRQIAPLTWTVSVKRSIQHRATVTRVKGELYGRPAFTDTVTIHGSDGTDVSFVLGERARSEASLLAIVIGYFEAVEDALVYCDELLAGGVKLTKKTEKALTEVMLRLSRGIGPEALVEQHREGAFATVVPGMFVRFHGTNSGYLKQLAPAAYHVGDDCVVSSWNLKYLGKIEKITEKFIWCRETNSRKAKRHTALSFRSYNHCTVEEAAKHNAEEMLCI